MKEKTIKAEVEYITPLTDSIMRIVLKPEHYIEYDAGQYLKILCPEQPLCYSIANAPLGAHKYELHIRHAAHNSQTTSLLAYIKQHGFVTIQLPYGDCRIQKLDPQRPILFIAGGTGFAPIHAMIEQLLANADLRCFELFWGARSRSDLYWDKKVREWQAHVRHFNYFSSLADENKESLVASILAKHQSDLADWQMVLSGPFDMVYRIRDELVLQGVSRSHLFSDAFDTENI